jgi:hypothetical protein
MHKRPFQASECSRKPAPVPPCFPTKRLACEHSIVIKRTPSRAFGLPRNHYPIFRRPKQRSLRKKRPALQTLSRNKIIICEPPPQSTSSRYISFSDHIHTKVRLLEETTFLQAPNPTSLLCENRSLAPSILLRAERHPHTDVGSSSCLPPNTRRRFYHQHTRWHNSKFPPSSLCLLVMAALARYVDNPAYPMSSCALCLATCSVYK